MPCDIVINNIVLTSVLARVGKIPIKADMGSVSFNKQSLGIYHNVDVSIKILMNTMPS